MTESTKLNKDGLVPGQQVDFATIVATEKNRQAAEPKAEPKNRAKTD